jgi:PII-like signaling protein
MLPEQGHLLRVFIGDADKHGGMPLYEWIVREAKNKGLAGATVLRGMEGFGASTRIHSAKLLDLSSDLPVIIEIVDELEKIEAFLPVIDEVVHNGLATVEKVHLRFYRSAKSKAK